MRRLTALLLMLTACPSAPPPAAEDKADLLMTGGTIRLSGGDTTDALAIRAGEVVAHGAEARALDVRDTYDLAGHVAVPGFHDAHVHMLAASFVLPRIQMLFTTSIAQAVGQVERLLRLAHALYEIRKRGPHHPLGNQELDALCLPPQAREAVVVAATRWRPQHAGVSA